MLTQAQTIKKYGNPCRTETLVTIDVPYPLRIAWDLSKTTKKVTCHKLIANNLLGVFNDILEEYGLEKIQELGIDLFGGIYNCRPMRGGTKFSKHAWGIAIDLDPARNGLKTTFKKAQFSKPEYDKLHEIFEKHGFINLGKTRGYDAMHWEINQ